MKLLVHPLTYRTFIAEFGAPDIYIPSNSVLIPIMTSAPVRSKAPLTLSVSVHASPALLREIHPQAGYNLYESHIDKAIQYINRRVSIDGNAWGAMMEYYSAIGLDIDELAPETLYKRYQRFNWAKNNKKYLQNPDKTVLHIATPEKAHIEDFRETVALLISQDPAKYHTQAGDPDFFMIKKATMYVMSVYHLWRIIDIADHFDETHQNVSKHIHTFRDMLKIGTVKPLDFTKTSVPVS